MLRLFNDVTLPGILIPAALPLIVRFDVEPPINKVDAPVPATGLLIVKVLAPIFRLPLPDIRVKVPSIVTFPPRFIAEVFVQ